MFENEHFGEQSACTQDTEGSIMILNERQSAMLEWIQAEHRASVKALAKHFYVSEMTVRRDLSELEKQGCLTRYNGGAVYNEKNVQLPLELRKYTHMKEKKELSARCKKYLFDGMTVYIDSSSTCLFIVPLLAEYRGVTIVTNSVSCLIAASQYHIPCLMAGGSYFERDMCTVGEETNAFFERLNPDLAFCSAQGISADGLITDSNEAQVTARRAILPHCKRRVFLFDATKQGQTYLFSICRREEADEIFIL